MSKMFVHYLGTVEQFKQLSNLSDYANKIVFIKGGANGKGAAIYTHGEYYANAKDLADLKFISSVKAGGVTATAQGHNGVIEFSSDDDTTVSVVADSTGIKIGLAQTFVKQVDDATDAIAQEVANREAAVITINAELAKKALATDLTNVSNEVQAIKNDYLTSANETSIKNTIIGTGDDAASDNTIYGAKKYAVEKANNAETAAKGYTDTEISKVNAAYADADTILKEGLTTDIATAKSAVIGAESDGADANTIYGAKKYADSQITAAIQDLNAEEEGSSAHVTVKVTEVAGKLTTVTVTESDIASAAVLKQVKDDVDAFFKDALKDGAEQVKDTLKEIQDYIDSDVEGAAGMAASIKKAQDTADKAQTDVNTLADVVAGVSEVANNAATKAELAAEVERANGAYAVKSTETVASGAATRAEEAYTLAGQKATAAEAKAQAVAAISEIGEASASDSDNAYVKATVTTKAGSVTSVVVDDSGVKTYADQAAGTAKSEAIAANTEALKNYYTKAEVDAMWEWEEFPVQ